MSNAGMAESDGRRRNDDGRPRVHLREMTLADVDAGLRLCRLSHWNQVARDWEQFLRCEPHGATVAVGDGGLVVGSVATMRYAAAQPYGSDPASPTIQRRDTGLPVAGSLLPVAVPRLPVAGPRLPVPGPPTLAWIAMVLVDPAARGRGVGTALLDRGMATVADATTMGLDATPLGQPLYEKLGFRADSTLTRMERAAGPLIATAPVGQAATRGSHTSEVRALDDDDLDAVARLDARASGLDRAVMLAWLREGAPELAWVSQGAATIDGFVLGRRGHAFSHIGPVIASSPEVAVRLVRTCIARHPDQRLIIDIADARPGWRVAVEALGFTPQRPFARMYRGAWRPAGDASLLFGSIGAEFG
jgi:ribosomal protein S18 acetylase RimI-like enzyme